MYSAEATFEKKIGQQLRQRNTGPRHQHNYIPRPSGHRLAIPSPSLNGPVAFQSYSLHDWPPTQQRQETIPLCPSNRSSPSPAFNGPAAFTVRSSQLTSRPDLQDLIVTSFDGPLVTKKRVCPLPSIASLPAIYGRRRHARSV